ncbi:plasmid pRiA4b ORF-3 family protein, partial [Vibrio navarrensis]|uniref:plasmid pRiA4b ORF-3 family protein n=1 Tax=Vibrio navarrensis TaxID=29495 RepID=UPI00186A8E5B
MHQKILRFRVSLSGSEPEIWREIDVPDHFNFWELHVAIQDVMGWLDYHLHEFSPRKTGLTKGKRIGRGRNSGHPLPPAQIRTCATNAYGSYLGSNVKSLLRIRVDNS